ncbi:hypothetical protein DFH09DRAFT_1078299 [Mycena vulgaris]|nr:hypothetical protein DFH09DRAFT_1078299 [Mycena vulgaris]
MALARIYFKPPVSAAETLLRELVGPPDYKEFSMALCTTGQDHGFQMNVGRAVATRIGIWELICEAAQQAQCHSQRGRERRVEDMKKYWKILAEFTPFNDAIDQACPPLPPVAAQKMAEKLESARQLLAQLAAALVPPNPEVAQDIVGSMHKGKGKTVEMETPFGVLPQPRKPWMLNSDSAHIFGDASDTSDWLDQGDAVVPEERQLDVPEGELEVVCPEGEEQDGDLEARLVRVVVYTAADKPPFHGILWAPRPMSFKFGAYTYKLPVEGTARSYRGYSTISGTYDPAWVPVNMVGRGNFMVYRKSSLHRHDCPGLLTWERRAAESVEHEPRGNTLPPSSPPAPPARLLSSALRTSTTSSPTTVVRFKLAPPAAAASPAPASITTSVGSLSKDNAPVTTVVTIVAPPAASSSNESAPAVATVPMVTTPPAASLSNDNAPEVTTARASATSSGASSSIDNAPAATIASVIATPSVASSSNAASKREGETWMERSSSPGEIVGSYLKRRAGKQITGPRKKKHNLHPWGSAKNPVVVPDSDVL